ncbi:MAG: TlpA family protein disulfide reductase [Candidatus Eiseniibacteriota bacterium]
MRNWIGTLVALGLIGAAWAALMPPSHAGAGPSESAAPPAFSGEMRQFTLIKPLRPAPPESFTAPDGATIDLKRFKGKVVLVNFWATWCAPCLREMPALDRLEAALGGERFQVVTISVDRQGQAVVGPFLKRLGLGHLPAYLDTKSDLLHAFGARGLPTSYLIDADGSLIGYLEGPAEWDSAGARALIEHYTDRLSRTL